MISFPLLCLSYHCLVRVPSLHLARLGSPVDSATFWFYSVQELRFIKVFVDKISSFVTIVSEHRSKPHRIVGFFFCRTICIFLLA